MASMMSTVTALLLLVHVVAEGIAGLVLVLSPSVFENDATFKHHEAMRGFGNGALSITLVGITVLAHKHFGGQRGHEKTRTELSLVAFLYATLVQYHLGIVWLQFRNPLPPPTPFWVAPLFHGTLALVFSYQVTVYTRATSAASKAHKAPGRRAQSSAGKNA